MTLEECKDQVAYSDGFENWETFELWCCDPKYRRSDAIIKARKMSNEAAELYAKHKADIAWEAGARWSLDLNGSKGTPDKETFMKQEFPETIKEEK